MYLIQLQKRQSKLLTRWHFSGWLLMSWYHRQTFTSDGRGGIRQTYQQCFIKTIQYFLFPDEKIPNILTWSHSFLWCSPQAQLLGRGVLVTNREAGSARLGSSSASDIISSSCSSHGFLTKHSWPSLSNWWLARACNKIKKLMREAEEINQSTSPATTQVLLWSKVIVNC